MCNRTRSLMYYCTTTTTALLCYPSLPNNRMRQSPYNLPAVDKPKIISSLLSLSLTDRHHYSGVHTYSVGCLWNQRFAIVNSPSAHSTNSYCNYYGSASNFCHTVHNHNSSPPSTFNTTVVDSEAVHNVCCSLKIDSEAVHNVCCSLKIML
jgi:hypothetical protein